MKSGFNLILIPVYNRCFKVIDHFSRSQWSRGLKRGFVVAGIVGLWVRIPPGLWMFVSNVSVVYCQVEVTAIGLSLVQGSPILCGVSKCVCDHET